MSAETHAPTPSAVTNQLIELCEAVKNGAQDKVSELQERAATRRQETDQAQAQFFQGVSANGEEFMNQFSQELADINMHFDGYNKALDLIRESAGKGDAENLNEGQHMLAFASNLLRTAMVVYERAVLGHGPSRFKPVNQMENLSKGLIGGKVTPPMIAQACDEWNHFYTQAIAEIDASQHKGDKGVPERRTALAEALEIIEAFRKLTPGSSAGEVEAVVNRYSQMHERLESAVNAYNQSKFLEGPTSSAEANLILSFGKGVIEGRFPPQSLKQAAEEMHARIKRGIDDFEKLSREKAEAQVLLEELPKMGEGLEALDEILPQIAAATEADPIDGESLRRDLDEFEAAVLRLQRATQAINNFNESQGKIPCPSCQHFNPVGSRFCDGCKRSLPQVAGGEGFGESTSTVQVMEGESGPVSTAGGQVMTDTLLALGNACESLEKGEMSVEEYLALLERTEAECHHAEQGLAHLAMPEIPEEATPEEAAKAQEFIDLAADALGLLTQGVAECLEGLEYLRAYVDDRRVTVMQLGIKCYFDGVQKIHQVQQVDDAFQKALANAPKREEAGEEEAPAEEAAEEEEVVDNSNVG